MLGLSSIDGKRFLAAHMLSSIESEKGVGIVVRVRSGYVDNLYLRILNKLLIATISLGLTSTNGGKKLASTRGGSG